jgi:hypothetical protein
VESCVVGAVSGIEVVMLGRRAVVVLSVVATLLVEGEEVLLVSDPARKCQ